MSSKPRSKTKAKSKAKAKKKSPARVKAKAKRASAPRAKVKRKSAPRRKVAAKAKRPAAAARPKYPEVPKGYSSVTAYLVAQDAAKAIDYYKDVFGAKETMRMPAPGGRIGHAELTIGDSKIMLCDESLEMNARGPRSVGGSPVTIMVYVKNVDAIVERAVAKGGKLLRPVKDQFYGDRSGAVEDPQGHFWHVSTHIEDVTPKELKRRMEAMMKESAPKPAPKPAEAPPPVAPGAETVPMPGS